MRAAVADSPKRAAGSHDPDLAASDPGDDMAVALELADGADVVPAHGPPGP
jgi:hypothetical protein